MQMKIVSESRFKSIFDYSSPFKYNSVTHVPKVLNHNHYKSAFSYHSVNISIYEDTDVIEDENWISSLLRKTITFLLYVFVIVTFPLSSWICIKKVHTLERIVLMRMGKLQPIQGPGFTFVLPLIDIWTRVDLRPQTFTVSTSELLTADGGIVELKSEVEYWVSNTVNYVTKLSKQEKSLKDLGLCCLTNIVSEKDQEQLQNNKECIAATLKNKLNESSLKWGIEILNVYLLSVKVLKAAEPVDALRTIMMALKAATTHSSDHATAIFPLLGDIPFEQKSSSQIPTEQNESIIDILKKILSTAEDKGLAIDITGHFKFDVVGSTTKTIYCSFNSGCLTIVDDPNCNLKPDVSLIMTENNMKDFLENKISPLEAYLDGKVIISGNWHLFQLLAKMFDGLLCTKLS